MNLTVHLLRERDVPEKILEEIERQFTQFPEQLNIKVTAAVSLPKDAGVLHWDAAFTGLQASPTENRVGPDDYLIVLTMAACVVRWLPGGKIFG